MSDRWVLAYDPRDGEVEHADWCLRHGQRKDSCGQCVSDELELDRAAALMAALDVIDEADDEQMGAHFAARFDKGE